MDLKAVVLECYNNDDIIKEFNRLTGHQLKKLIWNDIDTLIDDACNYKPNEKGIIEFIQFVEQFIWMPLISIPQYR